MLSRDVLHHLSAELARPDPWRLQQNPFEQARYTLMLQMLEGDKRYDSGLEIGCAAGAFTERLAERCARLRVVDVLPEAIRRCRARLAGLSSVHYTVADISEEIGWNETYDLVVVSEVFYYLQDLRAIHRVVTRLYPLVRRGGIVIFGSAADAVVRRWGLEHGAETAMAEWTTLFREVERHVCRGPSPNECALLVKYTRDA